MSHRQRDAHLLTAERQLPVEGEGDLGQPLQTWQPILEAQPVMAASPSEAGNLGRTAAGEVVDAALTIWSPRASVGDLEVGDRIRVWPQYLGEDAAKGYKLVNERHHYARRARPQMYVFDAEQFSEAV